MRSIPRIVAVLAALLLSIPAAAQQPAAERFRQLLAEDWEFRVRESPLFATSLGIRTANDRLDDVSLAATHRRAGEIRALLDRLRAIPRDSLDPAARVNYDILLRQRREDVEEYELKLYLIP
ncbi:MAG TPA: DUF885 family protein, partial [Longimicrobium sp.]|nr:DUF885 family protein [Longimicrobium sp.]